MNDLENWVDAEQSHKPETMWNVFRGTMDYETRESAYMVLVIDAVRAGHVHIFVGRRHNKSHGGASSSSYGQDPYSGKRPGWVW